MPNSFLPRCSPIWGWPAHLTIADFPATKQAGVKVLTDVTVSTLSPAQSLGARSVEIDILFANGNATFDLKLFSSKDGYTAPVKSWTGLNCTNTDHLFAGNLEMIDLEGYPLKFQVLNPTDKVTVLVRVTG
jgi:hypothetical protein